MARLIVISNRIDLPTDGRDAATGGLAVALAAALRKYEGVWFGWSGQVTERYTGQLSLQQVSGVTVATVDLEEQDVHEYYNGYANRTLWPLFHYRIDLTAYERSFGQGYDRVNRHLAETLQPQIQSEDLIWVHDYHLIPLARELRKVGVKNAIGFFLHIPWPARQLLVTLPRHRQLVEALFHYDVVGFQTEDWLDAFEGYIRKEAGGTVAADGLTDAFGRTVRVGVFPIGIDAQDFINATHSPEGVAATRRMTDSLSGQR